jgi:hypothetical protein
MGSSNHVLALEVTEWAALEAKATVMSAAVLKKRSFIELLFSNFYIIYEKILKM